MKKIIDIIIFLCIIMSITNGQSVSVAQTTKDYSLAQEPSSVINTAQLNDFLSQYTLEQDISTAVASNIAGNFFLLPWPQTFSAGDSSHITQLVNTGRISDAIFPLNSLQGWAQRQRGLEITYGFVIITANTGMTVRMPHDFMKKKYLLK